VGRTTASKQDVLIVGAGIIGIACAHYLSKAGLRVAMIDRLCSFFPENGKMAKVGSCLVSPEYQFSAKRSKATPRACVRPASSSLCGGVG
jgi:L-2-hydroxyglutarate oxidase LhgO